MPTVDIVIATFGDDEWQKRGKKLATLTRKEVADFNKVITVHESTLATARNFGAENSKADYIIFLDADDHLDSAYVTEMQKSASEVTSPTIFQPATRFLAWDDSVYEDAHIIPDRDMFIANNLVVGSMVGRKDFLSVGGFKELPVLEDWELFLNLICTVDAKVKKVPEAIYNVRISRGRNTLEDNTHLEIRKSYSNLRRKYLL
jgi:glycosyltransferase involved in cell wall biosynthesis